MNIQLDGDVSFVSGWQRIGRPYGEDGKQPYNKAGTDIEKLTGLPFEEAEGKPTAAYYEKFFPALHALITTPVAFSLLAPFGWTGERSWYSHEALVEHGWEPLGWRESSHQDKTWVQLYMKRLERAQLKEPVFKDEDCSHAYVGTAHKGTIAYLGCSSILSSFAKPRDKFEIPAPTCFRAVAPASLLHLIRQRRPGSIYSMSLLRKEGFKKVYTSPFCHYWLRAKSGVGTKELCEY